MKHGISMKQTRGSATHVAVKERLATILAEVPFAKIRRWGQAVKVDGTARDLAVDVMAGGAPWRLLVAVTESGEPRVVRGALQLLQIALAKRARQYGVLAAPYVGPRGRAVCCDAGVGFLDLAGNCRLVFDQVFIERVGAPNPRVERRPLRSIFAARASRVLRVLFDEPRRGWQVQQLARQARVSLGLAFKVKQRLLDLEYAREAEAGTELARPEDLLRDWAAAGLPRQREPLECYAPGEPAEVEAALRDYCRAREIRVALTLFSGAARVAPFARYARSAAYVDADPATVARELGWKPVPSGANATLLVAVDEGVWYGLQQVGEDPVVSDVQLYLDLVATKGRGEEAATFVLEQRLRPRW
jgi:hypothetical protein